MSPISISSSSSSSFPSSSSSSSPVVTSFDRKWSSDGNVDAFKPLPETQLTDAPEGHEAWTRVKFQAHSQGHLYFFKGPFHFQVTVGMALNSGSDAARICRLCYYLHTTAGATKEQLVEFRNRQFQQMKKNGCKRGMEAMSDAANIPEAEASVVKKKRNTGAVGSSWASQLGTRHSKMRAMTDPLADFYL
eukprot:CAMPEP_0206438054 /NCGR_PEP_ID=MMETSP0324_2-20121206/11394_1 /ASSEMBLY_ACC=CAM_ASM_000836 /TAXON_ID=2866 /ORGANISM="Crypthecodinium cohnii, Strain Seligo" /LENGTH=189 /DNA_ID=CAMNT_0053905425 /DNA_START=95 /DNA_END=664 /DNA_ORIENTATION=-